MEGLLRTTGRAEDAVDVGEQALELISMMGLNETVHHATTLQNVATANRVAGNIDKAQDMYIRAAEIYRYLGYKDSYQMASLYHNLSHIQQEKNQHSTALIYLETAMDIISRLPDNEAEIATTNVCMALSYMALEKFEEAAEIAVDTVVKLTKDSDEIEKVLFSVFDDQTEKVYKEKLSKIES